jgi:hypothetical protein
MSSSIDWVRWRNALLVAALALAGCGASETERVVEARDATAIDAGAPTPADVRPANSLEELVARAVDNSLAVSVARATVWTVTRSSAESVLGSRLNRPDEDVYVVLLEGRFRWIFPSPPGAIVPDFVDVLISIVSVATGAGLGGGTRPDGPAVLRAALGPGTEIPVVRSG